jgi:hypothetical protein
MANQRSPKPRLGVQVLSRLPNYVNEETYMSYSVGQILYCEWLFTSGIISFYQIVKTTRKTITIKQIDAKVMASTKPNHRITEPVKDSFCKQSSIYKKDHDYRIIKISDEMWLDHFGRLKPYCGIPIEYYPNTN